MNNFKKKTVIWTAGLVVGNLIGAGILALPVSLGLSGMIPAFLLLTVFGGMMFFTAEILSREAISQQSSTFDFPSLYDRYLGHWGKWAAIITNGIILYGLLVAYISGAAQILADLSGSQIPVIWFSLGAAIVFSLLAILDLSVINRYNAILVGALLAVFLLLLLLCLPHLQSGRLVISHWEYAPLAIPLAVTACHFHNIIPVLCKNLDWDLRAMRHAVLIGMFTALTMNILWTLCGIGTLPRHGNNSLFLAYQNNLPATVPMRNIFGSNLFTILAAGFSITAIVTSFIANSLGLMNFIRDLLSHSCFRRMIQGGTIIKCFSLIPPAVIALVWPGVFIKALDVVGGVGIVTLFGILPCLIAIRSSRYSRKIHIAGLIFLILSFLALGSTIASLAGVKPNTSEECCEAHSAERYIMQEVKP